MITVAIHDKTDFASTINKKRIACLRENITLLPPMCAQFFRGVENETTVLTRIGYSYDLQVFFRFLAHEIDIFKREDSRSFTVADMENLQAIHVEMYMEYLNGYEKDDRYYENGETGKSRKLASLRSFMHYLFKNEWITKNVVELVDFPKLHKKPIIRLEADEVAKLIDLVDAGDELTEKQQDFHRKTRLRDLCMITMFLTTGMRISECVGVNINDIDFNTNGILITRKGGNKTVVYFGDELESVLTDYLEYRKTIAAQPGHEDALFLSLQKKRITPRAVQLLVKKYASVITPLKHITPHKLRSTYGTSLYRETGDIYLVAEVLGHSDVNTTRRHYAAMSEDHKRAAANAVKLRDDK